MNAFFEDDRQTLTYWDVSAVLQLLSWTRCDLLSVIDTATQEQLIQPIVGEIGGSISGILRHVAGVENWYLDQLGLALDQAQLPEDPLQIFETVCASLREQLPGLVGGERVL